MFSSTKILFGSQRAFLNSFIPFKTVLLISLGFSLIFFKRDRKFHINYFGARNQPQVFPCGIVLPISTLVQKISLKFQNHPLKNKKTHAITFGFRPKMGSSRKVGFSSKLFFFPPKSFLGHKQHSQIVTRLSKKVLLISLGFSLIFQKKDRKFYRNYFGLEIHACFFFFRMVWFC